MIALLMALGCVVGGYADERAGDTHAANGWLAARASSIREWRIADGGNGHRYSVISTPDGISWSDAKAAAELLGGHLATVTTPEENAFVFSIAVGVDEAWATCAVRDGRRVVLGPWIGATQADENCGADAGWAWVTGEVWAGDQWAPHEPNDRPDSDHSDSNRAGSNQADSNQAGGENRAHYFGIGGMVSDGGPGGSGTVLRRSPFWNDMVDKPRGTGGEPGLRVVSFVVEFEALG